MVLLTEEDVIQSVCDFLSAHDYDIVQRLTTKERGVDVIARRHEERRVREVWVEAKGATSANPTSARFGLGFNSAQVRTHVAEAFCTASIATTRGTRTTEVLAAIALPDDSLHRRYVRPLDGVLAKLKVGTFWVSGDREVRFEGVWDL